MKNIFIGWPNKGLVDQVWLNLRLRMYIVSVWSTRTIIGRPGPFLTNPEIQTQLCLVDHDPIWSTMSLLLSFLSLDRTLSGRPGTLLVDQTTIKVIPRFLNDHDWSTRSQFGRPERVKTVILFSNLMNVSYHFKRLLQLLFEWFWIVSHLYIGSYITHSY